ncbi:hypothetical protein OPV43_169 [Saccharomyces cerevisiae synthetic construct]|uniref:Putative uncharacterized membrane protein YAL059C-A n=1 Tax=Saccharomyces cerevisiae (strain ATCC 204508 / S288c) TaxID=559292 RepID=YA059_YEAST|nr:RecName: Full=Putative uncharacterized membrane protein YAL059C-A [Saccharomyces cerevisiae S288C]AHX39253.1 hypothetical protein YAL059C-A [Saccharomyces cerevisiae]UZT75917.1 hypothetical protein OPV43_169 [Saccharomyces cerevisiae synthetic construct]
MYLAREMDLAILPSRRLVKFKAFTKRSLSMDEIELASLSSRAFLFNFLPLLLLLAFLDIFASSNASFLAAVLIKILVKSVFSALGSSLKSFTSGSRASDCLAALEFFDIFLAMLCFRRYLTSIVKEKTTFCRLCSHIQYF